MKRLGPSALVTMLAVGGCLPAVATYPSYEDVASKYDTVGATALAEHDDHRHGEACGCHRVLFEGRWVYYYRGHWEYWDDAWYWYPGLGVVWIDGIPYLPRGTPIRSIRRSGPAADEPSAVRRRETDVGGPTLAAPAPRTAPAPSQPVKLEPRGTKK